MTLDSTLLKRLRRRTAIGVRDKVGAPARGTTVLAGDETSFSITPYPCLVHIQSRLVVSGRIAHPPLFFPDLHSTSSLLVAYDAQENLLSNLFLKAASKPPS